MAPVQQRLDEVLSGVTIGEPAIPVVANVDAAANSDSGRIQGLLVEQVCAPVRWVDCVQTLSAQGADELLELGPGRALAGMVRRIDKELPTQS